MPALTVPYGNNVTLGIAKETTFGTFVTPTVFHAIEDANPQPEQLVVMRTGARGHQGQSTPIIAGFKGVFSLTPEADGDTIGQIIALGMGAQTAPSQTIVNTTITASTIIGATSFTVASIKNIRVGQQISVDTSANLETVTVTGFSGPLTVTTTAATKAHASGVGFVLTSTTAYTSDLTLGALSSFSMELNRVTNCIDYTGCAIDGLSFGVKKQKGLVVTPSIVYSAEAVQGSPTSPTYSTKIIPMFENTTNLAIMGSQVLQSGGITLHDFTCSLKNNLETNYRPFGSRNVNLFPQKQRSVSGTIQLGFESGSLYTDFINNGGTNATEAIRVAITSTDMADATLKVPFGFEFNVGAAVLTKHGTAIKGTDLIYQTFSYSAGETTNRGNDDIRISLTNTASAAY